jgi:Pentaxin family/Sushi repeat (SCR repeat)
LGAGFSESESYVGQIAYLDIWNHTIDANEVQDYYTSCEPYHGNLITWTDVKINIKGDVKVLRSQFCKACEKNLVLPNGNIEYNDEDNYAVYRCDVGFKLDGAPVRSCLRTSQWEIPAATCKCKW